MTFASVLGMVGFTAILVAMLFYYKTKDTDEYMYIRLFLLFAVIFSLFIVGKTIYDQRQTCDIVEINTTKNTSQQNVTTTHHDYGQRCFDNPYQTETVIIKWVNRLILAISVFLFVYITYKMFRYASEVAR